MATERVKKKITRAAQITGAIGAVALLIMQLFWSEEFAHGPKHTVFMLITLLVMASAVIVTLNTSRKKQDMPQERENKSND